jgi:hypothetical protein
LPEALLSELAALAEAFSEAFDELVLLELDSACALDVADGTLAGGRVFMLRD